jgi:hypothetical protein
MRASTEADLIRSESTFLKYERSFLYEIFHKPSDVEC